MSAVTALPGKKRRNTEVASQWQLMYWKFTKHKLALIAAPVIGLLLILALFGEFFAPSVPNKRYTSYKGAPPNGIHFIDEEGNFSLTPFVYEMKRSTDPVTFARSFAPDPAKKYETGFFVKGEPYELWGVIPGDVHFFGTKEIGGPFFVTGADMLGRDLFSRIVYGARVSLAFGVVSIAFTFCIGVTLGGLSGYLGGMVDVIIQRLIDLLRCIPTMPLWMSLAAALPREMDPLMKYFAMIFVMSLIGWTELARVVRGKILSIREEDFTVAARLSGASDFRIIFSHMLPSFASYMIVVVTMAIPGSILGETALSFLGLGLQAPVVSWGVLLQDAQTLQTLSQHPWLLFPVVFVIATVLSFNFVGDGLRDAADPYSR